MSCISLKILVVSMMLNMLTMPISSVLAIIFGYVALISSVMLPIELLRYNGTCINKRQLHIIFALVIIICLNSFISLTAIRVNELEDVIKALFSFFSFLLAIAAKDVMYTEKDLKFFFSLTRIFAFVLILYTVIPFDFRYVTVNNYGNIQFTLSMGNPNATATKILFALMLLGIENSILKNKYWRWCNVALIAGLLNTILLLQSRTALVCALIFLIYHMLLKFRIRKWMTDWVWIIPIIFIPIQLTLSRFPLWQILDKSLSSGRETMFVDFIELISSSPLQFVFGDFAENKLSNTHNIIFAMIFNFGFIGLILFLRFWKIESRNVEGSTTKIAQYAWVGWIVFVIHSMAEAAVLSGSFTFGAILILLNRMTKDQMVVNSGLETNYDLAPNYTLVKEGRGNESITTNRIRNAP